MGNLDAKRDWGHAKDYVDGMWKILQYDKADDFVLATGKSYSIRDFVEEAFSCVNIEIIWKGKGLSENGINKKNNEVLVEVDKAYYRPSDVNCLRGDATKALKELGWKCSITFKKLVKEMMKSDLN